jgi:DNA (cytosine-5)-methyltransferase 1
MAKKLNHVLFPDKKVKERFFVDSADLGAWKQLKNGGKSERRHRQTGTTYFYSEGAIPFPDSRDAPARTILTAEGGLGPSRFKHIVLADDGIRMRRLTPEELERLNGFPRGWTRNGMSDVQRAFCMGNAVVVGVVRRIGREIARDAERNGLLRRKRNGAPT